MNLQQQIQKIKYLRLLTESLKGGWSYMDASNCPCGHLAKIVTGLQGEDFQKILYGNPRQINNVYAIEVDSICPETGLPMCKVIEDLFSAGFTADEIRNLEKAALSNKRKYIFDFISQWRTRLITETEAELSDLGAELQVEVLLTELKKEKELV